MKRQVLAVALAAAVSGWSNGWAAEKTADAEDISLLRRTGKMFTRVSREAVPAVVFIQVEKATEVQVGPRFFNNPHDLFSDEFLRRFFHGGPPQGQRRRYLQRGQGSGFLISRDGYILTNNHVVGDADKITVRLSDGREFEAERIGSDEKSEVAVIKIDGDNFPFIELGDSDEIEIGEWVLAVGNPFGLTETVTAGVVSAKGRSNVGIADYENFIQTDAAINPGNSGGPLLTLEGKAVGINTAIYSRSGGYMGIGFAVPINMARKIKDQLVESGKVVRGYLGVYIQPVTTELAEMFELEDNKGILISDVMPDSAAERAGLQSGDVVLKLNGKPVGTVGVFRNAVASHPPETELTLDIWRDGKARTIKARTATLPSDEQARAEPEALPEALGLQVTTLTPEMAELSRINIDEGVMVQQVVPGSPSWDAGLRQGQVIISVNHKPVETAAEFRKTVAAAGKGATLLLRITDGSYARYVTLKRED